MAEQISILHMEVNFQFDGIPLSVHFAPPLPFAPPKKGMHPPNRRCTPLSRFLSKRSTFSNKKVPPRGGIFLVAEKRLRRNDPLRSIPRCKNSLQSAFGRLFFYQRIQKLPLISPLAASSEAPAVELQNKPGPVPAASFHWPYAQRGNPSAPSDRYTQILRRHSTIYSTPH